MKRQRLTEAEERRLAEAIAAEARALGLTKKDKMPQETKRRLRARILKAILDERTSSRKREAALAAGQMIYRLLELPLNKRAKRFPLSHSPLEGTVERVRPCCK